MSLLVLLRAHLPFFFSICSRLFSVKILISFFYRSVNNDDGNHDSVDDNGDEVLSVTDDLRKCTEPCFQLGQLSDVFTIAKFLTQY